MRLDRFLAELLYDHDCVIIPGFGGLVATYRSARLNERTHVISPPTKHVGFNRNLLRNDGLLISHISSVLGIAYAEASAQLETCVAEYRSRLAGGQRIVWESIGFLFLEKSGALQFIPDEQENFLSESFGLGPVQLRPVAARVDIPTEVQQKSREIVRPDNRRWMSVAAVAVPLIVASAWLLGMQMNGNRGGSLADFNPFRSDVVARYSPVTSRDTGDALPADVPSIVPTSEVDTIRWSFTEERPDPSGILIRLREETAAAVNTHVATPHAPAAQNKYSVIAGAFKVEENAHRLVEQFRAKGFSAEIAGMSHGMLLVSCGSYATHEEAVRAVHNLRQNEQVKAWVRKN